MTAPRRGRRPGAPDTRSKILAAARSRFAEQGYGATSVRAVAADAGVDAALVHHYFGSKDDLFLAALELPVDPREVLAPVAAGGVPGAGERLLRAFLSTWDDPELQPRLVAFARSVVEPSASELVARGFLPVAIRPIGVALGLDRSDHRMALVASQVLGLMLARYVLRLEPLASLPAEEVVATYAPTLQRYLEDPLP